eukprot:gnl/MRDRNA2_/MRDRNA2_102720_c0_seq1.p1 gnl/MRDRNA2_/MRDRNA2_102720_c0~~gnl/MRDRNA2_/MRDRNA2_102720_c0_seq1.p1  ORF type:complete len:163 (+),score=29.75 gnl/MRDRNA2_/MRDRNA2_102720_c0_seq1:88-576(+)
MATVLGQMAGNMAQKAADTAQNMANNMQQKVTPPPPKVWCVTLRRKPALTEEDQPEIGDCEKLCIKIFLIPIACLSYIFGWIIYFVVYTIGTCCCPLVGPQFFVILAKSRLEQMAAAKDPSKTANQAKADAENAKCCAMCLLNLSIFAYRDCICPITLLCDW